MEAEIYSLHATNWIHQLDQTKTDELVDKAHSEILKLK